MVINMAHHKTDLIHVRGNHYFLISFAFFKGNHVAHVINGNIIGE